ncbi:NADH-quinone oxidoreductase subunit J [Salana multivorans]
MESIVGTGAESVIFWVIGPFMVIAALALLFARKPVHAAIGLIFVMIGMAFLYTTLEAPFLGVAQVVVYTGAIMILFVFVLMLVGVDAADSTAGTFTAQRWVAYVLGAGLLSVLAGVVVTATLPPALGLEAANADTNPVGVAYEVFGATVFTLELVGVLLIVAALSAITLTHKQQLQQARDQKATVALRQRAYARGEGSQVLTPQPAPGVYAEHNAADVPALDPQGRPINISVPRVLRIRGQELDPASFDRRVAAIAASEYFIVPETAAVEPAEAVEAAETAEAEVEPTEAGPAEAEAPDVVPESAPSPEPTEHESDLDVAEEKGEKP